MNRLKRITSLVRLTSKSDGCPEEKALAWFMISLLGSEPDMNNGEDIC